MDMGKKLSVLNVYGPYSNRVEYWDTFFKLECIQNGLVVIGGDLNFTLGAFKIWGPVAQIDCLLGYFLRKLEEVGLLDIEPTKLSPT
jgi:hypothetical protein